MRPDGIRSRSSELPAHAAGKNQSSAAAQRLFQES